MMRWLLISHRYLGVLVGLLMVLWCLSGFVMMYRGYPHLDEAGRQAGLSPLRLATPPPPLALADDAAIDGFRLEMMGARPVLRLRTPQGRDLFDLRSGQVMTTPTPEDVQAAARSFGAGHGLTQSPQDLGLIADDQWTVEGAGRRGPVRHFRFGDPAGTELYVAERTGEAVQVTDRAARAWAWAGAIPHWLYPHMLRRNGPLWARVVIWTSLIGVFLTATGLFVGVVRFRRLANGRWSPYRGWFYWHHMLSLAFGVLTLTWVASGLLSMNPWGLLDSAAGPAEHAALAGQATGAELKRLVAAPGLLDGRWVQVQGASLGGRLYAMAAPRAGPAVRLDAAGVPRPLAEAEVRTALAGWRGAPMRLFERIDHEDAYFYNGYERSAAFPAFKAELADAGHTAVYIDGVSGEVAAAVDTVGRQSRWLRTGLHDWDFPILRIRPLWDAVILLLLAGVTAACATGGWLAISRVLRDLGSLRRH